jgi:hypothetical protein
MLSSEVSECEALPHGRRVRRLGEKRVRRRKGRAVQVDPIKPTLKAPGTKRLNLQYDELLSIFAFKFNLRRYAMDDVRKRVVMSRVVVRVARHRISAVGPHRCCSPRQMMPFDSTSIYQGSQCMSMMWRAIS